MFVRKKKNFNGKICIQVIDKSLGKYKVIKTIDCSQNTNEVKTIVEEGHQWIKNRQGILEFDFSGREKAEQLIENIEEITTSGTTLLLEKIYNSIGFNEINDKIFKILVFSRIVFPNSKL